VKWCVPFLTPTLSLSLSLTISQSHSCWILTSLNYTANTSSSNSQLKEQIQEPSIQSARRQSTSNQVSGATPIANDERQELERLRIENATLRIKVTEQESVLRELEDVSPIDFSPRLEYLLILSERIVTTLLFFFFEL
jgi:hypothetical protein